MRWAELGVSWHEAGLVVITAAGIYLGMLLLSRVFGQRSFSSATTYDLPFVFAIGSIIGRVILVRTSLVAALLGLLAMFVLHHVTGFLHHRVPAFHRVSQNRPTLLVADGQVLDDRVRDAGTSDLEIYEALRLHGLASLSDVLAVVLERNGEFSVVARGTSVEPEVWQEVAGADRLPRAGR